VNDTSLQIIVPVGEPVDVDRLRSIFSDAGIRATVEIEEQRIVNLDANTALVSLFLMTFWRTFIEALAKTTGEGAQYSPEAVIWILKRPPDPLNNDLRTVFVWDSICGTIRID
jgi:hypothetical protein